MFKTVIWTLLFLLLKLIAILILPILLLFKPVLPKAWYRRIVYEIASFWGRIVFLSTGSRLSVVGRENIPKERNVCIIANHQSLFDIPVLLGFLHFPLGFIGKKELLKVPVISQWMQALRCVFIDRKNPRAAIKSFETSAAIIKSGSPIVIFPEGTRSKGGPVAEFKAGSLKLAFMAEAIILPITIDGSFRIYEQKKKIGSARVKVTIHPAIHPEDPVYKDKTALAGQLQKLITDPLNES